MGNWSAKAAGNNDYLNSGRWKCDKSPSGAHYWLISNATMTCRHCGSVKSSGSGESYPYSSGKKPTSDK